MSVQYIDDSVIVGLARDVCLQVAPQEMPLFRANSALYLKDPERAVRGIRSGDDLLGFGTGAEVLLLTPIIMGVVTEVVKFLANEVAKAAGREGAALIDQQVRHFFTRFHTPGVVPPPNAQALSHERLVQIREVAYEAACRMQLSAEQASLVADATVGGLVVA